MERRHNDEFNEWVLSMLRKYGMSRAKLGRVVGIEVNHIRSVLKGQNKATRRTKCLIIDFFKKEYNESFIPSEEKDYITLGDWLDSMMLKYGIENDVIAKELDVNNLTINNLRKGIVRLEVSQRKRILDFIKNNYEIDTSKGEGLLNTLENKHYKEMGEWLCDIMKLLEVKDAELSKCVNVSTSTIYGIKSGRKALSYRNAKILFGFFDKCGIDTADGRKKFEEMQKYKEKVAYQI